MKEGWTYKKLGEVCEILDSQRKPVTKKDRTKGIYPYYGASGIQDYVDSYIFDGRFLLVGEDGAKWGASDKSAFIIEGKSWVNNHAHILKVSDSINDRLIEYYLTYKDLTEYISGAVVPKLTQKSLVAIPIPVPPIAEQERIVAELDLLSGIIEKKKEQLKAYDQLAQSIFYTMFGDILNASPTLSLKDIASYIIGLTYKPSDVSETGTIVLRSSNIQNNLLDFKDIVRVNVDIKDNKYVQDGDILMCARNGSAKLVGKVARIKKLSEKTSFGAFMTIIRSDYNDYLFHFFLSDYFRSQLTTSKTATINQITSRMLDNIKLNVPPLSLQQEFAEKVEAIERQKALVQQSIDETQTMFDYTMDKYFG